MKTHLHEALRADRGQHEQQRGVRQPAWPVRWAGLLLSARHHNKQPSPRVTHTLPMSQGKDKESVRGLPVRIKANSKKKRTGGEGGGGQSQVRRGGKGWEGKKQARASDCGMNKANYRTAGRTAFGRRYMDRRLGGGNVPTRYAEDLRPVVCERRRSTWHRLVNTHAMGSWEGQRRGARIVRTGAGGTDFGGAGSAVVLDGA